MTSTCEIIVTSLSSLGSKLNSDLGLNGGFFHWLEGDIYNGLKKQIKEILFNFTFFLPLSDCLNEWIVIKDKKLQSQIQATIEEAVEKVRPEDVDDICREICEMTKERAVLLSERWSITKERASKLSDVLSQVNAKILILKPKIQKLCREILLNCPHISQLLPCEFFSRNKKFWFKRLVSSACSCLSEIKPISINRATKLEVLELRRNLSDLQIFIHGISDIPVIEYITREVACVAVPALLLACRWWILVCEGLSPRFDDVINNALLYLRKKISIGDPKTAALGFGLLKSLKAIDHSLFIEKVIEFSQYILPHLLGLVEYTRETGSSTITISTLSEKYIPIPNCRKLILETEKLLHCWLPKDEREHDEVRRIMINLFANVNLMRVENFSNCLEISGKWKIQNSKNGQRRVEKT